MKKFVFLPILFFIFAFQAKAQSSLRGHKMYNDGIFTYNYSTNTNYSATAYSSYLYNSQFLNVNDYSKVETRKQQFLNLDDYIKAEIRKQQYTDSLEQAQKKQAALDRITQIEFSENK